MSANRARPSLLVVCSATTLPDASFRVIATPETPLPALSLALALIVAAVAACMRKQAPTQIAPRCTSEKLCIGVLVARTQKCPRPRRDRRTTFNLGYRPGGLDGENYGQRGG